MSKVDKMMNTAYSNQLIKVVEDLVSENERYLELSYEQSLYQLKKALESGIVQEEIRDQIKYNMSQQRLTELILETARSK